MKPAWTGVGSIYSALSRAASMTSDKGRLPNLPTGRLGRSAGLGAGLSTAGRRAGALDGPLSGGGGGTGLAGATVLASRRFAAGGSAPPVLGSTDLDLAGLSAGRRRAAWRAATRVVRFPMPVERVFPPLSPAFWRVGVLQAGSTAPRCVRWPAGGRICPSHKAMPRRGRRRRCFPAIPPPRLSSRDDVFSPPLLRWRRWLRPVVGPPFPSRTGRRIPVIPVPPSPTRRADRSVVRMVRGFVCVVLPRLSPR